MKRSKEVRLVLLTTSMAALLAACDDGRFATLTECEQKNGKGACGNSPPAVMMTAENRPLYTSQARCESDFGQEKCESEKRSSGLRVYRPIFYPGQTYFYPYGHPYYRMGYYNGSASSTPSSSSSAKPFVKVAAVGIPATGAASAAHSARTAGASTGGVIARGGFGRSGIGGSSGS
jgi:uncharacterized protein YgiB involved in biofilm formation